MLNINSSILVFYIFYSYVYLLDFIYIVSYTKYLSFSSWVSTSNKVSVFTRAFLHPFEGSFSWIQLILFTTCLSISVNLTKLIEFEVTPAPVWITRARPEFTSLSCRASQPRLGPATPWPGWGRTRSTWSGPTTGTNSPSMAFFPFLSSQSLTLGDVLHIKSQDCFLPISAQHSWEMEKCLTTRTLSRENEFNDINAMTSLLYV